MAEMDMKGKLEVIAHLGDHITYKEDTGICYDSALAKVIEDAYMILKNGVTVQDSKVVEIDQFRKWIPVAERLPDVDGRYLCFHRGAYANWIQSVQFAKDARKFDEYAFKKRWKNKWLLYDSEYGYYAVDSITHWMFLPQPPKVERRCDNEVD